MARMRNWLSCQKFPVGQWLCAAAVSTALLVSCGKSSVSVSPEFLVVLGNNQVLAPREASKQAIEFRMVDNNGLPLSAIPVEIRLFEYEENDKAVDVETVRQLWDKQVSENIELNSPAFAEKVGRVDGSRFLSTDGDGKISVALIAPSLFSAHVIVAARTISGQAIPDLISFAQVKTSSTEDAGKLTLESNFENNIIPAGKNVDFWIVLRDQTGAIVTGYEGPALFNLEAQKPSDAWAGLSSVDFRSEFTCNFIAGRCAVAGGPFNFAKAEKLNISVQGLKPATSKVTTTIEILKGVTPAQVIAADKKGGPDANAQPLRDITMKAGESLSLAAAWIDEGGNYLGDATDTRWLASSQTFQQFLPADARTGFTLEPNITGVFELKLNSVAARESSTIPVEVQAGSQAGWKVVTQNNGVETAGSCFRVTVSAVDAAGNTIPNVEGETLGLLEIAGAVATPPLVNDVAHFTRLGLRIASNEAASRINLRFGTGSSVEQVCLFDATDVSPKIVFSANGFSGETPVTVLKGQPAVVRLSRENTGDSAANECSTPLSPDNLAKPCITFNADEMMLPTPEPTRLYAALTDIAGNFVSNTEAQWQITGPLGELKSDSTPKFAIIDTMTAEQQLITTLSGKGTFLVTPASGEISPQRFAYEVKHGIPSSAQVTTLEGGRQKTTQPFRVKATLLDKWNNVATAFTGSLNAQVSLEKAPFSPNGAESVAAFSWNMDFAAGGGELVSSETLQLPCACNPEIQPSAGLGCRDQSANPAGYLLLTEDASDPEKNTYQCPKVQLNIAGLGSFFSEPLTVTADALAQLKLRNRAGGLGEDITQLYSDTTPLEQEIFKPLTLYVAGYDSLGNFRGEASSDNSWQWTSEGMDTEPVPEFQSRSASPSLVSNVTGDGRLSSVAVGNAGVSVESPTIRFKSSRAVRYAIVTNNTDANTGVTTEVAGEPFQILLKAIDPSGNVDPNFSGDRTFTWTAISDPSWDDTLPVLPDGQGFSCTFASGVCLLPTPMENPAGWVISNSLRASILNVVEDTPADQLPVGSERLEGTFASTFFVTAGNPYRLVYTDKVGGPSSGAKVTVAAGRHLQMTTDETFSYFLAVTDKAGNYVSELNAAKVEGDATYVIPYATTATTNGGTRIQFKPELKTPRPDISRDPEPVQLLVSSNTDATLQKLEIQISVHHGRPQKALTRLLKKGQSGNYDEPADTALVAGECYSVDVLVTDATDNAIDTLTGTALSKTGVRNFSVSQDYLNLNGGFYKYNETSGMFTGFRFGTGDSSFSGSEYTVRSRKVSASTSGLPYVFQAGGFTNWEHIERGKLTSSEALFFCVGDLQATPEVLVTLLGGLSYRDKDNVAQLAAAVSGTSQTHSVVAGPPAALTFFMNFVDGNGAVKSADIGGQSRSEMRLCTYGPAWGNDGYVTGSVVLAPTTANTPPIVKFSEDYQNCLAMNVDLGGLNLSAKVTDIAGNILSQTPSGTWNYVNYSTGSGQVDGTQFVQTATSFHDPLRRAGVFTIEYTETTTGLKATVVAKVKAGRASNFNLSVSPTVAATQAFNGWMSFVDAWGNPYCAGHYIPNLTGGFGWDPLTQSSTLHIAVPYKIEWVGTPPPTTIKVPVGRPLTSDNSPLMRNATCALGNSAGSGYFGSLQIPKTGNYTLQFSSNQLFNRQGVAGSLSRIADINVLPGPVVRANVEYFNAPSGLAGEPTQGGQALPAAYVPGDTEAAPQEIKSFGFGSNSATSNVGVAVYLSGYDQEDNFNKALPSVVTSVADPVLDEEFEYSIQESIVRSRCNNLTLSVCSFSQLNEQTTADKIHVLVGQRAGVSTLEIRPTDAASSAVFRFKVRTVVGPDWQKQLIGTEKDYSEVVLPEGKTIEQIASGSTNVMVGSKLRFKLRVVDYNFNTYTSESGPKFVNFGFDSAVKITKEGYENTVPTSGEYNFSNGVSSATFTSQIYTAGVNSVTAGFQGDRDPDRIKFSGSGIIEAKPFHHYGTITTGSGVGGAYRPSSQFTDTFSTIIELRDEYGNALSSDKGPQLPVRLTIVREDGTTTAGPLCRQQCPPTGWETGVLDSSTQNITLSALENQTEIADLKYPQAGKFKIFVSDGQSTEPDLNVKLRASSTIVMESSFDVVAGLQLTHINANPSTQALSVTAGQQTEFTAKVVDLYGGAVSGIDGVLNNVNFSWSEVAAAPNGTAAILPSSLSFSGGQAQVSVRFYKAETRAQNTLTLSGTTAANDSLTTSYGGELVVLPGAINEYRVQTCLPSQPSTCDTSKKTFKAEKSNAGFFDIKIETFDEWMNPRSGDSGVSLVAREITGPGSNVSGFLSSTGANEDTAQDTTNFNLAANNGSKVFSQLWYPVGHTVELDLNNASVSLAEKPQLEFQYTENSITAYKLDFSSNSIVSGDNNLTLTITAQDKAKNTISTLDTELNSRQFIISGPLQSPNGNVPKINGTLNALAYNSWPFVNGVATQNMSLYKAQTINTEGFLFTDNIGIRGKNVQSPIVVLEGSVSQFRFRQSGHSNIPKQTAGQSFTLLATTTDNYGNLSDVDCAAGLELGAMSSSPGGWGGTETAATIPAPQKTGQGEYTFAGVRLTRSGTQNLPYTGCSVARTPLSIQVVPDVVNRMVLTQSNSVPATNDLGITGAGDAGELTCSNPTLGASVTDCGSVYSFFWDQFGNRIDSSNNSCQWSWTNATATHGLFIQQPPNLGGTGGSRSVSSSDFVDGVLSCSRDSTTKQIRFWGGVAKVDASATFTSSFNEVVTPPNVPAGTRMDISSIQAWSSKDGQLVALPSAAGSAPQKLSITSTLILKSMPTSPTCQFANSACSATYTGTLETAGVNGKVTLGLYGKVFEWDLTVDPGAADSIDISGIPTQSVAGIPIADAKIIVRDFYGNATNTAAGGGACNQLNLTIGSGLSSPGGRGLTQQAPSAVPASPTVNPQNRGEYSSTLSFYKAGTNTLEVSGCGLSTVATLSVSPSSAAIGYLSTQSTDATVLNANAEFECSHTNNSSASAGVTCNTINAFFWDDWGNGLNGGNPVSCEQWQYTTTAPQNGLPAAVEPTKTFSGGSATLVASDFIDGALTCSKNGKTAQSKIYGGISKITVGATTPATIENANIIANNNNLTISQIQLWQRRDGDDVAKSYASAQTLPLKIETTGVNGFADIVSGSETGYDAGNSLITRSFNTSGVLVSPLNLSFKKAPPQNTNGFTLRVKNKTVSYTGVTVEPNNAHTYKLPTLGTKTAGVAFGFDVEILDQFGNRTKKKTDGTDCSGGVLTLSGSGASPGGSLTSIGTQTVPDFAQVIGKNNMSATEGVYSLSNVVLYRAGGESLSVQACGLNVGSFALTVDAAPAAAGVLRKTNSVSATADTDVSCSMHSSANTVDCAGKNVHAFFWDQYGNLLSSAAGKCDSWAFDPQNRNDAVSVTPTASTSVPLANKGTHTWVDGEVVCTKSPLTAPLAIDVWGGVKTVSITAKTADNGDATNSSPTLAAGVGNLKVTQIDLKTTRDGNVIASPVTQTRQVTWNTTATHQGWGTGGSGSATKLGQAQQPNLAFASGTYVADHPFNFIKAEPEPAKALWVSVYGIKSNEVGFKIIPTVADDIRLNKVNGTAAAAFPALTAGTPFSFEAEVLDAFGNTSQVSKAAGNNSCEAESLTVDLPAGQTKPSPGEQAGTSLGTVATFASSTVPLNNGTYTASNVQLYNSSNTALRLAVCGLTEDFAVSVNPASVAHVAVNASATVSNNSLAEYQCSNSGAGGLVRCDALYAYFWDTYGNPRSSDTCDSWNYATTDSAPLPTAFNAGASVNSSANLSQAQLTGANSTDRYFDGVLTCSNNRNGFTTSPQLRLWGGVSKVVVTAQDGAGSAFTNGSSVQAALGNIKIGSITAYAQKAGSDVVNTNITGNQTITWSTTATPLAGAANNGWSTSGSGPNTPFGQTQTVTLNFNSGVHSTVQSFNFAKVESNRTLSASLLGVESEPVAFTVTPAVASELTIAPSATSVVAGTALDFTVSAKDGFSNPSFEGCGTATLGEVTTGALDAPNGAGAVFPAALAQSGTVGTFVSGSVTLKKAGSGQIVQAAACGLTVNSPAIDVSPAAAASVAVNTSSTRNSTLLTELECSNSGAGGLVRCDALYAYFWDTYGNPRSSDTCDSWNYATTDSAPLPTAFNAGATVSETATLSQAQLTGANSTDRYFDGVLTCNRSGINANNTLRLWGGVSKVTINHNVAGASIAAALGNVEVSTVSVQTPKNGTLTAPTQNLNKSIVFLTNATGAQLQGSPNTTLTNSEASTASRSCALSVSGDAAVCDVSGSPYQFNFTKAEQSRTFDVSVHGVLATPQLGFTVEGGTAHTVAVTSVVPTQVTAGDGFNLDLAVTDLWSNPTATGCGAVTIEGPTVSQGAGPAGAKAQGFDLTAATGASAPVAASLGVYNISGLKLYDSRATQTLNISACGENVASSPSLTVLPAAPKFSTLTNVNSRATSSSGELLCSNAPTTPYAVGCTSQTAYAWFWDEWGNEISSSSKSGANDHVCDSWAYMPATGSPTGFSATGAANSLSSGVSQASGTAKWLDGTLACVKSGVSSPSLIVWGGVRQVKITARSAAGVDITASNPTLIAGSNNLAVSAIELRTNKEAADVAAPVTASHTVTWSTNATIVGWGLGGSGADTKVGQVEQPAVSFNAGALSTANTYEDAPFKFNFIKAEDTKTLKATLFDNLHSNQVGFSVSPAAVETLQLAASPTTVTAGGTVALTLTAQDVFENLSSVGCATATLSPVGDLNSPSGDAPVFTPASPLALSSVGTFESATVALKKAGSGQQISASACGKSATSPEITVNAASASQILLSTTNAQPAFNTTLNAAADLTCTEGSTVNCPAIYAFAEDTHGNPLGSVACGWAFAADTGSAPTLSASNGASTVVSNASSHIDGTLTCQAGGLSRTVPLFGKISKTPQFSCGAWACSNTTPVSTCSVSNSSGYDIASMTLSGPTPTTNNCSGALASGSNCSVIYEGTTGAALANATLTSTAQNTAQVAFSNVTSTIGGGVNAPNCSQSLGLTASAWSCDGNTPQLTVTFTNSNGVESFAIATGSPSLTSANGATLSTTCSGSIAADGGSCTVTISGTTAEATSEIELSTSGTYFQNSSYTTGVAPTCP